MRNQPGRRVGERRAEAIHLLVRDALIDVNRRQFHAIIRDEHTVWLRFQEFRLVGVVSRICTISFAAQRQR